MVSAEENQESNLIGKIPVRNIWLLLLYASDLYKDRTNNFVNVEDNPDDIPDLVAEILCRQVNRRIHRNLTYGYMSREDILDRVRGSIDLLKTEANQLLDRGKIACRFEELSMDTPRNRFVRDALEAIAKIVSRTDLQHQCRSLAKRFRQLGVTGARPNLKKFSSLRFGRNDQHDRPMMEAAFLAFNLALPTESDGGKFLPQAFRKIEWLRTLFEKGIAGFYDVKLSDRGWKVDTGKRYNWQLISVQDEDSSIMDYFPRMITDIVLEDVRNSHRIVIDTKFNSLLTAGRHDKETVRSGYIYQIYAYLRSQEGKGEQLADAATGMLLHPSVGDSILSTVSIQNHKIRFATVDLCASYQEISKRLLQIVDLETKPAGVVNNSG